jgi:hypothetical protein
MLRFAPRLALALRSEKSLGINCFWLQSHQVVLPSRPQKPPANNSIPTPSVLKKWLFRNFDAPGIKRVIDKMF